MSTRTVERPSDAAVREAFAHCERLAKSHYENFSVATWLFPKRLRPSMYAVYAFCRYTDDLGDESTGDRLSLLDAWEQDLRACYEGTPQHPIMVALQRTTRQHDIPLEPFLRLIQANRTDQRVHRYPTYADLLNYCEHSANAVGHMVLHVFGYSDQERTTLSDATCTALQLANFWQDIRRDYALGRIYLPEEDMSRFGYSEAMLARSEYNEQFCKLMAFEVERARGLFRQGAHLTDTVRGELRLDLRLFTSGGVAILDAIERQHFDVFSSRPRVTTAIKTRLAVAGLIALVAQRLGLTRA